MIRLTMERPNTVGVTRSLKFDSYSDAEQTIESWSERLADRGYELSELKGSTSRAGTIEATHDYQADVLLIQWSEVSV